MLRFLSQLGRTSQKNETWQNKITCNVSLVIESTSTLKTNLFSYLNYYFEGKYCCENIVEVHQHLQNKTTEKPRVNYSVTILFPVLENSMFLFTVGVRSFIDL